LRRPGAWQQPGDKAVLRAPLQDDLPALLQDPGEGAIGRSALQVPHRTAGEAGRGDHLELQQIPGGARREGHRALRQPRGAHEPGSDRQAGAGPAQQGLTAPGLLQLARLPRDRPRLAVVGVVAGVAGTVSAAESLARMASMRLLSALPLVLRLAERRSATSFWWRSWRWTSAASLSFT